jgi:hypothetical protein
VSTTVACLALLFPLGLGRIALPYQGVAQASASEPQQDLRESSLDELIDLLPTTNGEVWRDEASGDLQIHPAVTEIERRLLAGQQLTSDQWKRALLNSQAIQIRRRWPADQSLAVRMHLPRWLCPAEIRLIPRNERLKTAKGGTLVSASCGTYALSQSARQLYQQIGRLRPGEHRLEFDVEVERGRSWLSSASRGSDVPQQLLWKGELAFDVLVVPDLEAAMPRAQDPSVDEAVRDSITVSFSNWHFNEIEKRTGLVVVDPDTLKYPLLRTTALSLKVDLLHGDEVVESRQLVAKGFVIDSNSVNRGPGGALAFCPFESLPAQFEQREADGGEWTLRVEGTMDNVLRLWQAEQVFRGVITIPVSEAIQRERERAGSTSREPWIYLPSW